MYHGINLVFKVTVIAKNRVNNSSNQIDIRLLVIQVTTMFVENAITGVESGFFLAVIKT